MNELKIIDQREVFGKQFRIYGDVENPLFLAKDVAEWIEHSDVSTMLRTVDETEKVTNIVCTLGGNQNSWFVTEDGLYELLMQSRKPIAKKFKKKVKEILKDIRKHELYITDNLLEKTLNDPNFLIGVLTQYKEEKSKNLILSQQIGELKPKADYTDKILKNKGLVTITQIAKDYGMSGQAMNELLHELGIQYKQSGQWLLYKEYHDKGYTHSETIDIVRSDGRPDIKMNTKWTQKGRLFLYELLKTIDVLPVIEQ